MEASKRILYERSTLPMARGYHNIDDSALDDYAIIADDTQGASITNPAKLHSFNL